MFGTQAELKITQSARERTDEDIPNHSIERMAFLNKTIIDTAQESLWAFTSGFEHELFNKPDIQDAFRAAVKRGLKDVRIIIDGRITDERIIPGKPVQNEKINAFYRLVDEIDRERKTKIFKIFQLTEGVDLHEHAEELGGDEFFPNGIWPKARSHFTVADGRMVRVESEHLRGVFFNQVDAFVNFNHPTLAKTLEARFRLIEERYSTPVVVPKRVKVI